MAEVHPNNAPKLIATLAAEIEQLTAIYRDAESRAASASRDQTQALNSLNEAQKKFDEAAAAMRNAAPGQTGWNTNRMRRGECS